MTNYILHVSFLLVLGFILYQVLLRKETFYSLNRFILSAYLILAFTLPLLQIPQSWSLRSTAQFSEQKSETPVINPVIESNPAEIAIIDHAANEQVTDNQSTELAGGPEINTKDEQAEQITQVPTTETKGQKSSISIDWMTAIKWIYIAGLAIFFINFLVQFSILLFYRIKFPTLKDGRLTIVEMEGDKAPFSFLNMIYINPSKYDYDTYTQILAHEKIHITRWHSFDIFLSEIALIVQWFNPFAWFYRKAVEYNLEYLTDQEMLAEGANAEVYQMNLLKVSVPELPLSLSTNYNQSFLKKRIHMMNAKKSSARSTWKYLFILPILGCSVALLNPTFINALPSGDEIKLLNDIVPEGQNAHANPSSKIATENEKILSELSDFQIKDQEDLTVKSDSNGFTITSKGSDTYTIDKSTSRTIVRRTSEELLNTGVWEGEINGTEVCFFIKKGGIGKDYYWSSTECMNVKDFTPEIKENSEGEFKLTRDPGSIVIKGEFENGKGAGRYTFTPDKTFISYAKSQGFQINEDKLIHFFLSGVDNKYLSFLKSSGYTNIDEDKLLGLAIHDVNEKYIQDMNGEFKKINYKQPSVDELIALKIHNVDMEYVESFGKELYEDLSVDQIVAAAIHNVDPKFISEFKALGYTDLTFDNLIAAAIHNVDISYVKELKGAGFKDITFDNLIAASIHNVDPAYIKKFKDAGFKDLTFDDMIAASIHNVDPQYIDAFKKAGLKDLDFDNLISAAIHNVDVKYLSTAKSYGFDLTFDQLISASIHNVDLSYIKAFKEAGLKAIDFDDMISASIHNVDPDFVKEFYKIGFSDLTFDNLIAAAIHNVKIEDIREFKALGFKNLSFDDFISAAIHNIRPSYIKEVMDAGFKDITFDQIISFGIHNVSVSNAKELQAMGFKINADKMIEANIHNVTPKFIKRMQDKGHKDLSIDEYIRLKIHGF